MSPVNLRELSEAVDRERAAPNATLMAAQGAGSLLWDCAFDFSKAKSATTQ